MSHKNRAAKIVCINDGTLETRGAAMMIMLWDEKSWYENATCWIQRGVRLSGVVELQCAYWDVPRGCGDDYIPGGTGDENA